MFVTPTELKSAIVRQPLVVAPETTVIDAIALMSGVRSVCHSNKTEGEQLDLLYVEARSSCVIVVDNERVVGILTERDVVNLCCRQQSFEGLTLRQVMSSPVFTLRESDFKDVFLAISLFQQHRIRHLPLLDERDCLVGLIVHESLRQALEPIDLLKLRLVEEVMTREVICAAPESSLQTIAQQMADFRISSVVIAQLGSGSKNPLTVPLGIVTERDLVQFKALGLNLDSYSAETVMSTPIFTIEPENSLLAAHQTMERHSIHRLVVTGERGELLGIVTQTSLLKAINPLELYNLAKLLETKVKHLEAEKVALLRSRAIELERQVDQRTTTLKAKAEREKLLRELATQIRSSLSLQTILDTTVEQVRLVLKCDRVAIWRFEAEWQSLAVAESTSLPMSLLGQRVEDSCIKHDRAEIFGQDRIRVVPDILTTEMSDCHREMLVRLQVRAKILVPLYCGERLWGLLNASESQHARDWTPEEVDLMQSLSVQMAIAIQQATTHQQLQEELTERQQAEQKLRESEQHYATLTEAAPVGIFRTDAEGNCIFVNDRWCQISGLTPEAAAGEGWVQTLHPHDRDRVSSEWYRSTQENRPFQLEYRFQRPDERVTWVYGQAVSERHHDGQIVGYIGTITDINDRKQAEDRLLDSEQRFRRAIESAPLPIMIHAEDGQVLQLNTTWTELTGYTRNDIPTTRAWAQRAYGDRAAIVLETVIAKKYSLESRWEEGEFTIATKNGNQRIWNFSSAPLGLLPDGRRTVMSMAVDVTERQQAEVRLRESEERYRSIYHQAAVGLANASIDGKHFLDVNPRFCEMFGYTREELLTKSPLEITHPDDRQRLLPAVQGISSGKISYFFQEKRYLRKDGSIFWSSTGVSLVRDAAGNPKHSLAVLRDISEQKLAEEALRESEARLRDITASVPGAIIRYIMHPDGSDTVTYMSEGCFELWEIEGHLVEQNPQMLWDAVHPDDLQNMQASVMESAETLSPWSQEWRITTYSTHRQKWLRAVGQPKRMANGDVMWTTAIVDISEHKQAEDALRFSEARFRAIFENAEIGLVIAFPPVYKLTLTNPAFRALVGYSADELARLTYSDITVAEDRLVEQRLLDECYGGERDNYQIEKRIICRDRRVIWGNLVTSFIRDLDGQIQFGIFIVEDITERKRAMDLELSRNRDLREAIFEESTDAIFFVEASSRKILDCNQRAVELFEASSKSEILERQGEPTDRHPLFQTESDSVRTILDRDGFWSQEVEYNSYQGNTFWGWITAKEIRVADTVMILVQITDISIRKQVEIDMSRNVEELKQLNLVKDDFVSTVSHELRTPLTAIDMATRMLRIVLEQQEFLRANQTKASEKVRSYLDIIQDQCKEEGELISDLLDLQRLNTNAYELESTELELQTWLLDITSGLRERAHQQQQTFEIDISPDIPLFLTDAMVLRRIVSELLNNACKYTPAGERIQLSVKRLRPVDSVTDAVESHPVADWQVQFLVCNTGVEISPEDRVRVFQPFYRAVKRDRWSKRGTGLGLNMVQKFVALLNGTISIEGGVNETCFRVTIPSLSCLVKAPSTEGL